MWIACGEDSDGVRLIWIWNDEIANVREYGLSWVMERRREEVARSVGRIREALGL